MNRIFRLFLKLFVVLLPWPLRRIMLRACFGFEIDKTARIGLAWVFPKHLSMGPSSYIGHLTVCINLDLIQMASGSLISRGNWITGQSTGHPVHFTHEPERRAELILGEHAAITNRHLLDCTNSVTVGKFSTFAGFQSQILTHSIDLASNRQSSKPVTIGDYCFVGTNSVILGGSRLPNCSILAAKSLLNKEFTDEYSLYGGVPARFVKSLPRDWVYFSRKKGAVD